MAELSIFAKTTQKSMEMIKRVQEEAHIEDKHNAFQAMRATLKALRDRIPVEEAADLGAQLPNLIAGYYYEGWKPAATPKKDRSQQEFLDRIQDYLPDMNNQIDAEHAARSVFKVLQEEISEGEIEDILKTLPDEIRELFPEEVKQDVS